ncbi:MAG: DUF2096 family protein [Candidatus Bathyarchaeota archaeon]|nr:MAG: DUF2096 family protein [Candidatus Bathyarchaeota archaeon]
MNYEYLWTVLEELIVALKGKGVVVPHELVEDLKSAQTFINIYRTEPTALEIATKIEMYLEKVEANLLYLAESDVGEEYAREYLKKVTEARMKGLHEKTTVKPSFVSGVPKDKHWIRINVSELISVEELDALIERHSLSSKLQENGHLLVYGNKADVKEFIKAISDKIGARKKVK